MNLGKVKNYIEKSLGMQDLSKDRVFLAIILLRVAATALITNTHYNGVYPISALAVGGLLGDVLFFAVSGFCYGNGSSKKFHTWYAQRFVRIYPAIFVMLIVSLLCGYWSLERTNFLYYFIFPTNFVFYGAIMLLYVPLYFMGRTNDKKHLRLWVVGYFVLYAVFYLVFVDKTQYLMNSVTHGAVLFLYFGAAMIGLWFRKNINRIKKINMILLIGAVIVSAALYFGATIIVRNRTSLYPVQIIVPLSLLLLTFFIVYFFVQNEPLWKKLPSKLMNIFNFIASLTLEIYTVQKVIIGYLEEIVFPLNWLIITALIIICAFVLKIACNAVIDFIKKKGCKK